MIDRAQVERLLAFMEQIHKPNHGVIAELCRVYLAYLDAPVGTVVAVCASDTVGVLESTIESGQSFKDGTLVRLVTDAEAK